MNSTLKTMMSARYVVGSAEQRLVHLLENIADSRADYCVVVASSAQRYLGLFRFADIGSTLGLGECLLRELLNNEIVAVARPDVAPAEVNRLLRERHTAVALVDRDNVFQGLITLQSYAAWALRDEYRRGRTESALSQENARLQLA